MNVGKTPPVLAAVVMVATAHGRLEARSPSSPEEDARLLAECARAPNAVAGYQTCRDLVRRLVASGPAARTRLWQIYDSNPTSEFSDMTVEAILDKDLADALAELPVVTPGPDAPVSAEDLARGGRLADSLLAESRAQSSDPSGPPRKVDWDERPMKRAIARFLRGWETAAETQADLARDWRESTCDIDSSLQPRTEMVLLAHLRRGDLRAAAGTALAVTHTYLPGASWDWRVRLLAAAGVDWEATLAARVSGYDEAPASELGSFGSVRAARLLLLLLDMPRGTDTDAADRERRDSAIRYALAAFVEPDERCDFDLYGEHDVMRKEPVSTPRDLQTEILKRLAMPDAAGLDLANEISIIALGLCRTESLPTLRAMARSPFATVRKRGERALAALGEPAPTLPELGRHHVRIRLNGLPLSTGRVEWTIDKRTRRYQGSAAPTDGAIEIDRDALADRSASVDWISIRSAEIDAPDDPWFGFHLAPKDPDGTDTVEVATQTLTLLPPADADRATVVRLRALWSYDGKVPGQFYVASRNFTLSASQGPMTFSQLQQGTYVVEVVRDSKVAWASPPIRLTDAPVSVQISNPVAGGR